MLTPKTRVSPCTPSYVPSVPRFYSVNGTIELFNYTNSINEIWMVESDCQAVNIKSERFKTQDLYHVVTIEGREYSDQVVINQYVNPTFNVSFKRNSSSTVIEHGFIGHGPHEHESHGVQKNNTYNGFRLVWSCVDIGTCIFKI